MATFLGSIATVLFAFRKHDRTAFTSLIIGICGLSFLLRYIMRGPWLIGLGEGFIAPWTFGFGFYLSAIGVICLLISGGSIFFDGKSI